MEDCVSGTSVPDFGSIFRVQGERQSNFLQLYSMRSTWKSKTLFSKRILSWSAILVKRIFQKTGIYICECQIFFLRKPFLIFQDMHPWPNGSKQWCTNKKIWIKFQSKSPFRMLWKARFLLSQMLTFLLLYGVAKKWIKGLMFGFRVLTEFLFYVKKSPAKKYNWRWPTLHVVETIMIHFQP